MNDPKKKSDTRKVERDIMREARESRTPRPAGHYSNAIITARNGGVRHQFADSIGGCSSNYR